MVEPAHDRAGLGLPGAPVIQRAGAVEQAHRDDIDGGGEPGATAIGQGDEHDARDEESRQRPLMEVAA